MKRREASKCREASRDDDDDESSPAHGGTGRPPMKKRRKILIEEDLKMKCMKDIREFEKQGVDTDDDESIEGLRHHSL